MNYHLATIMYLQAQIDFIEGLKDGKDSCLWAGYSQNIVHWQRVLKEKYQRLELLKTLVSKNHYEKSDLMDLCKNCGLPANLHRDKECPVIEMHLDPIAAMCVLGNIQLATRHPANNGSSLEVAVKFARALQERIEFWMPDKGAIMEMGWDPNFDVS